MSSYGSNSDVIDQAAVPLPAPSPIAVRFVNRCADLPVAFDLVLPSGASHRLGRGDSRFRIVARTESGLRALASLDQGQVAEAYFAGEIDIDGDMLSALRLRGVLSDHSPLLRIWRVVQPLLLGQSRLNKRAISHHYDRDPNFFLQFLDPEVPIYTQGVYERDDEPSAVAALRKFDYLYEKCRLKPGDHILEIGPGWGAWMTYATRRGVRCTGISISQFSIDYLNDVARREGYDWELIFSDLLTYETERKYDAIVIMGIIEHLPQYDQVLRKFMSVLKPGGYIFLDAASQKKKSDLSSVVIKHIFPGNHMLLVLQDFLAALSDTPLELKELHDDRHSYHLTFRNWALNLEKNRAAIIARYGEEDYRKFRLYLWGFSHNMSIGDAGSYRMILRAPEPQT